MASRQIGVNIVLLILPFILPVLGNNKAIDDEVIFKSLFKYKRAEQLRAAKAIASFEDLTKQNKTISMLFNKIFEILTKTKVSLESSDYIPGEKFPTDETLRDALSQTLENAAFLGDIVLRLPDLTQALLNKNHEWRILAHWSIGFSNSTALFDDNTVKMINLVAQELNLVQRQPSYFNPYKIEKVEKPPFATDEAPLVKKKKKLKRGPQLSGARHEL